MLTVNSLLPETLDELAMMVQYRQHQIKVQISPRSLSLDVPAGPSPPHNRLFPYKRSTFIPRNVDNQLRTDRRPELEETLLSRDFLMAGGGKAANGSWLARHLGIEA